MDAIVPGPDFDPSRNDDVPVTNMGYGISKFPDEQDRLGSLGRFVRRVAGLMGFVIVFPVAISARTVVLAARPVNVFSGLTVRGHAFSVCQRFHRSSDSQCGACHVLLAL